MASDEQTSKTLKDCSLGRTLVYFIAGVTAVHALVTAFHLMMLPDWTGGRLLRDFYYSHSPRGRKETWPLVDYYVPIILLMVVTVGLLMYRSIWMHLAGWILCCVTILGTLPLYSTRLVPTPVSTWGTPRPMPFQRPPDQFPTLLLTTIFSVMARYSARSEGAQGQ